MSPEGFNFRMAKWMPFQDQAACRRVAAIKRADIAKHPNPDFKINVIDDGEFSFRLVTEIFSGLRKLPRRGGGWCLSSLNQNLCTIAWLIC